MPRQLHQRLPRDRATLAKEECQRRIYAVVDRTAQINLAAAAAAGVLTNIQMAIYREGLQWIRSMRATWPDLAEDERKTITLDHHWPEPSEAVKALGASF